LRWVVLAGPVSGYTFELFRHVRKQADVDVGFVHDLWDEEKKQRQGAGSYAHDTFEASDFPRLVWPGSSVRSLRDFILNPAPDAVFVYGTAPKIPILFASLEIPPHVPIIFVADVNIVELTRDVTRTIVRAAAYRWLLRRATAALSLGLTNRLALEVLGARRIIDAPFYAVDYSRFSDTDETAVGRSDDRLTVLIVARHVAQKNLVAFAAAVARHSALAPRVRIVFVGEGPERPALERLVSEAPFLCAEVLGPVRPDRLGPLFRRADVLALPSTVEPWGIVVTEALGLGIPVVCSPAVGAGVSLAGLTQAVTVADNTSADALCAALARFVELGPVAREAAMRTAPYVRSRYDVRAAARGMLEAVDTLRLQRA
jgi:glycosyltransferase involved in cell wall biosynthesis